MPLSPPHMRLAGRRAAGMMQALAPPCPPQHRQRSRRTPRLLASLTDLFRPEAPPAAGRNGRARIEEGKVAPMLTVPASIPRPPYATSGKIPDWNPRSQVQDAEGVLRMRAAGKLAAEVLNYAGTLCVPGATTEAIDAAVHARIVEAGAYPSPLNYGGFPKSVCTSLNEVICHGIPDTTVLQAGDIINVDVTVFLDGFHGDTSRTFLVGAVDAEASALVSTTQEALHAAIAVVRPGGRVSDIGAVIQRLADSRGYGVCASFVGHGVGRAFHSGPTVVHCRNMESHTFQVGETFTIEPMLTLGRPKERMWADGWTAVTEDGSWTAQFEHTLLVVPGGVEVLTLAEGTPPVPGLPSAEELAAAAAAVGAARVKPSSAKPKGFGKR